MKCKQRHKPPVGASCTKIVVTKPKKRKTQGNTDNVINLGSVNASQQAATNSERASGVQPTQQGVSTQRSTPKR